MPSRSACLVLMLSIAGACSSPPAPAELPDWSRRVVLRTRSAINGCAIGDLDPTTPGNEIAAIAASGELFVLRRDPVGWIATKIGELAGEPIQCAIGDADPTTPGDELVVVGMAEGEERDDAPGRAHLLQRRADGTWGCSKVLDDARLLHAAWVTEGAIVVAGFSQRAFRLAPDGDDWKVIDDVELPGAAKSAVGAVGGIAFACTDGSVVVWRDSTLDTLSRRGAARARLAADADGSIVVADDDGTLSLLTPGEATQPVWRSTMKLRGAARGDFDPMTPGKEIATAGYDKTITLCTRAANGWNARPLSVERDRLHHLASGELGPEKRPSLVAACLSGELLLLQQVPSNPARASRRSGSGAVRR